MEALIVDKSDDRGRRNASALVKAGFSARLYQGSRVLVAGEDERWNTSAEDWPESLDLVLLHAGDVQYWQVLAGRRFRSSSPLVVFYCGDGPKDSTPDELWISRGLDRASGGLLSSDAEALRRVVDRAREIGREELFEELPQLLRAKRVDAERELGFVLLVLTQAYLAAHAADSSVEIECGDFEEALDMMGWTEFVANDGLKCLPHDAGRLRVVVADAEWWTVGIGTLMPREPMESAPEGEPVSRLLRCIRSGEPLTPGEVAKAFIALMVQLDSDS